MQVTLSNTSTVASASTAAFAMSAVTDAEGNFAFSGVPTGDCVLAVEPPLGWQAPEPQTVTVTAGAPTEVSPVGAVPGWPPVYLPALHR